MRTSRKVLMYGPPYFMPYGLFMIKLLSSSYILPLSNYHIKFEAHPTIAYHHIEIQQIMTFKIIKLERFEILTFDIEWKFTCLFCLLVSVSASAFHKFAKIVDLETQ